MLKTVNVLEPVNVTLKFTYLDLMRKAHNNILYDPNINTNNHKYYAKLLNILHSKNFILSIYNSRLFINGKNTKMSS